MKKVWLLGLMALGASTAQAATIEVDITDFAFSPQVIDIEEGDTVRWTNRDSAPHLVQGSFASSPNLASGEAYEFTFNQAGTFDYICQYHQSMTGTVRVALSSALPSASEDEALLSENEDLFTDFFPTQDRLESTLELEIPDTFSNEVTEERNTVEVSSPAQSAELEAPAMNHSENHQAEASHHTAHQSHQTLAHSGPSSFNWWVLLLGLLGLSFGFGLLRR